MAERKARNIEIPSEVTMIAGLKEHDITDSLIYEFFGEFNGKSKYHTYDTITIPAGSYGPEGKKNKTPIKTTIGIWLYNIYFIQDRLFDLFKYLNMNIGKKMLTEINSKLSYALLEDKISLDTMKRYVMQCQKMMPYCAVITPNYTMKMMLSTKAIDAKKKELYKKYKESVDAGDPVVMEKMDNELLEFAREYLKDDPSMDQYNSKALGSFENNFKNMFIMKGATKDPDPNKGYNVIMSNYLDGISAEEYANFARSLTAGPYARAKKTELGGYWEKLFLSAYSHLVLGPSGSDCGTTRTITETLTKDNIDSWMYCYMVEGPRLIELTSDNRDKYIGKTVKFRFASMCENPDICNKCAGNLFYRMGVQNVGTAIPQIASVLKNISMKAFHDSTVKTAEMDPMAAFGVK